MTKRREERRELYMVANCKTLIYHKVIEVLDITEFGCKVEMSGFHLQKTNRVAVKPENFESFYATVKWVNNRYAGLEFDRPLHPAVVDHLCGLHPREDAQLGVGIVTS